MTTPPITAPVSASASKSAPYVFVDPTGDILAKAGVGSTFEKTAHGWKVRYVDGGTVINVDGPSIYAAMSSHGKQVIHPPVKR